MSEFTEVTGFNAIYRNDPDSKILVTSCVDNGNTVL